MNKNFGLALSLLLVIGQQAFSQTKEFETEEQTWFGYFNQTRFTDKSGMWVDLHLRLTGNFFDQPVVTIARAGYTYYVNDHVKLTAGYAYATRYSTTNGPNIPEHRPWQQIQWVEKKSWFTMMQWVRLDERFRQKVSAGELIDDYSFNYRIRYNMAFTIPLKGKQVVAKTPFLFANNEVMINFGKEIVYNYFDQNRAFVGLGYQFTSHLNAQLGYMYVFQQLPAGNEYLKIHAIRLFVFHNLDLRKKDND
jgi:long-subunit fatty acid transport protein